MKLSPRCRASETCSAAGCRCRRRATSSTRRAHRSPRGCSSARVICAAWPLATWRAHPTPPSSAATRCSTAVLGRVHDAGVDVAELLEPEQVRRVLGGVERVRRGLVDRQRTRVGLAVGRLPGMDLLGLEAPVGAHVDVSPVRGPASAGSCGGVVLKEWSVRRGRRGWCRVGRVRRWCGVPDPLQERRRPEGSSGLRAVLRVCRSGTAGHSHEDVARHTHLARHSPQVDEAARDQVHPRTHGANGSNGDGRSGTRFSRWTTVRGSHLLPTIRDCQTGSRRKTARGRCRRPDITTRIAAGT